MCVCFYLSLSPSLPPSLPLSLFLSIRRRLFKQYNTSPAAISDIVSTSGLYSSQRSELTATTTCIPSPSTPTSTTTVLQVYGKPVVDYDKWKQIFTRYIIRHAQITIMDNIGEGKFVCVCVCTIVHIFVWCVFEFVMSSVCLRSRMPVNTA